MKKIASFVLNYKRETCQRIKEREDQQELQTIDLCFKEECS